VFSNAFSNRPSLSDRLIGAFSTVGPTVNAALDLNLPELELSSGWAVHTDVRENMPEFRQVFEAAVIDSFADPRLKENYEAVNYPWESVEYGGPRRPAAGTIVGGVYAETIQSLGISIVDEIRFDILSAKLPPGAKMTVKMLCERYDCGASPVREALNKLSSDSLVVRIDKRGFFVSQTSQKDFGLYNRGFLEGEALRRSIKLGRNDRQERIGKNGVSCRISGLATASARLGERAGQRSTQHGRRRLCCFI